MPPDIETHLGRHLGPVSARASVTFLGTEAIEVLRFVDGAFVRYVTVGMSRHPMTDPTQPLVDPLAGPRAELVLSVRALRGQTHHGVVRTMAVLASAPAVDGLVLSAGASLDLDAPLWEGARFHAVLLGAAGGLVPDLALPPAGPVRFHPVLPMTAHEAAWKRANGADALEALWLAQAIDLRDPGRRAASFESR
ncbi:MAG: suppressor of fused domain protein [Candidatus Nanopelagicales bacterium]